MVTLGWVFGAVWFNSTSGAPLTLFAKSLGASPLQFGLLAAMPFLASLVSMPASWLIERSGQRKGIFLASTYFQRLLWFPIALVPLWLVSTGTASTGTALLVALILMLLMHAAGAVGTPAWVSWMADVVPDRLRGKFFSRRRQWGIMAAVPAALIVGWILDHYSRGSAGHDSVAMLRLCALVFMCAAVFGLVDIVCFQPVPHIPSPPQRGSHLLRSMREPLHNRQFLFFAAFVGTLTFAVSFMGHFVTLYLIEKVGIDSMRTQLMLLVAPMLAQLLVLPVWGLAVDRMGKKPLLVLSALGMVPVGLGWCFLTSGNPWLGYILAAGGAALWTGVEIANFNMQLEMSGGAKGGGSSYVAVNSIIVNIAGCLGGVTSGLIAQWLYHWHWQPAGWLKTFSFYDVLFVGSAALRLAAVAAFLPFVHEPAAAGTREALRFVAANIYNNLFNAVLQPIRYLRASRRESFEDHPEPQPAEKDVQSVHAAQRELDAAA